MRSKHLFKANLKWRSQVQKVEATPAKYLKNHLVSFEGKEHLEVSAAKAFKGDLANTIQKIYY